MCRQRAHCSKTELLMSRWERAICEGVGADCTCRSRAANLEITRREHRQRCVHVERTRTWLSWPQAWRSNSRAPAQLAWVSLCKRCTRNRETTHSTRVNAQTQARTHTRTHTHTCAHNTQDVAAYRGRRAQQRQRDARVWTAARRHLEVGRTDTQARTHARTHTHA